MNSFAEKPIFGFSVPTFLAFYRSTTTGIFYIWSNSIALNVITTGRFKMTRTLILGCAIFLSYFVFVQPCFSQESEIGHSKTYVKTLFGRKKVKFSLNTDELIELDPRLVPYLLDPQSDGVMSYDRSRLKKDGLRFLVEYDCSYSPRERYFDYSSPKMKPEWKQRLRQLAPQLFSKSRLKDSGDYDVQIVKVSDFKKLCVSTSETEKKD